MRFLIGLGMLALLAYGVLFVRVDFRSHDRAAGVLERQEAEREAAAKAAEERRRRLWRNVPDAPEG